MHLLVAGVLLVGLVFQSNAIPLAHFSGKVKGATKKVITIETEEGNVVEFSINRKTRIQRGKKAISSSELKTGDPVTVDARQELLGYLVAVEVSAAGAQSR